MPTITGHRGILGDVAGTLARLEALASHLECFGSGKTPSARELEAAPLLDPFAISMHSLPCLLRSATHSLQRESVGDGVGRNGGHPILKGPTVTTSEVRAIAPDLGWARTYSRLYPLQSRALQVGEFMRPGDPEMRPPDRRNNRRGSR